MSGEISIAPMTTAGEDRSRPSIAIPADIRVMNAKWPDQKASSWTRAMTARWSTALTTWSRHQELTGLAADGGTWFIAKSP